MTQSITLYDYWRSSCSWRIRWALRHKAVPYASQTVNLLTNEQRDAKFLAKNPMGFVPAIEISDGVFGESLAILEWIEETYPQKPLLPAAPVDRMRVRQICQIIASGIQPIQNLSVMKRHSPDPKQQSEWAHYWIERGLQNLEPLVTKSAGTYCVGGSLTFADLCLIPQIYNALRFNVNTTQFPTLMWIYQHCLTLPECVAASPQNQPGSS